MPALFGAVTCEKDHGKRETQLTNPPPALFRSLCNGATDSCAVTFGFLACSLGTVPSPIALVTLLHRSLGLEAPLVAESALGISARQAPWLNIPISLSAKFLGLLHDSALLALPAIIAMPWLLFPAAMEHVLLSFATTTAQRILAEVAASTPSVCKACLVFASMTRGA